MQSWLRAVSFFAVVPPLPRLMLHAFAAITAASALAMGLDEERARAAVVPVLVLQVFATSTGFAAHARRGHYDLLLTGGVGRLRTAIVQWVMASTPGMASWGVLALAEVVLTDTAHAVASGTVVSMLTVSTIPWALTVALPRFSGAIGWLLLAVVTLALASPPLAASILLRARVEPDWLAALAGPLFPMRMVGADVTGHALAVVPALVLAAVSMTLALLWIQRAPLPLESGQ